MAGTYVLRQMDDADARTVAGWRYGPPYDFYDSDADSDDLAELLDPKRREGVYFSVREGEDLVGFFQFEKEGVSVAVGLGLRPDLTGRGLGPGFVLEGLGFAGERFAPARFTLSVATFNKRAISVYERVGFWRERIFTHETNGGEYEFLSMVREV